MNVFRPTLPALVIAPAASAALPLSHKQKTNARHRKRRAPWTEAERAEEARRDVARYKLSLEEELRKRWRASEQELRLEALDALSGEARAAIDARDALHARRRQMQRDVEVVARGAAAVEARNNRLAAERHVAEELAEEHARCVFTGREEGPFVRFARSFGVFVFLSSSLFFFLHKVLNVIMADCATTGVLIALYDFGRLRSVGDA